MSAAIVTGVDGSTTALDAALTASRLATALEVELIAVCAFNKLEVEQVEADGREYVFTTQESALVIAEEAIRALQHKHPDLQARAVAEQGKPADVLPRVADNVAAGLIVVGNKRVQGAARFLGSIATDVAHKATCDVYVANTHSKP